MTSLRWTHLPVLSALVLVLVPSQLVSAARSDRNMVSEEYVGATVNATVLDGRGNTVHAMSSDDGTYGQNSPKVDTKGIVIAPAPHHGGTDITTHLGAHTWGICCLFLTNQILSFCKYYNTHKPQLL